MNHNLLQVKLADKFRWLNVGTVLDRVDSIARGLSQIGVSKGDKVLLTIWTQLTAQLYIKVIYLVAEYCPVNSSHVKCPF